MRQPARYRKVLAAIGQQLAEPCLLPSGDDLKVALTLGLTLDMPVPPTPRLILPTEFPVPWKRT